MPDRWLCTRCEVSVTYAPGRTSRTPAGWVEHTDGWRCIRCQRAEVVLAIPGDETDGDVRRARQRALCDFELRRNPDRGDGELHRACGAPLYVVREIRKALIRSGAISPRRSPKGATPPVRTATPASRADNVPVAAEKRQDRHAVLRERIDAALLGDPLLTNAALASRVGCNVRSVRKRRAVLEDSGRIPKTIRRGRVGSGGRGKLA